MRTTCTCILHHMRMSCRRCSRLSRHTSPLPLLSTHCPPRRFEESHVHAVCNVYRQSFVRRGQKVFWLPAAPYRTGLEHEYIIDYDHSMKLVVVFHAMAFGTQLCLELYRINITPRRRLHAPTSQNQKHTACVCVHV